jgi:endonuclease I
VRNLTPLLVMTALLAGCGAHGIAPTPQQASVLEAQKKAQKATLDQYYGALPQAAPGNRYLALLQKAIAPHKDLGYDHGRDLMFGQLDDVTNADTVVDVYSGRTFHGVTDTKTAFERGLNAEHTWCQSMGAKDVAKDDLHHLFPVDAGANSTRNNNPMGEVKKVIQLLPDFYGDNQHSRLGTNANGVTVFEPRDSHKGDVARAIFYFYVVYGSFDGKPSKIDLTNFKLEHDTLLRWHQQDPPSSWEIQRNNLIYKLQGNRNPFIDHPDWVGRIGRFI